MSKCFGDVEELFVEEIMDKRNYDIDDDRFFDKFISPEQYVKAKLRMLQDDMCIHPTGAELSHLYELKTATTIDTAVRSIIDRHWSQEL